ncbi:hypothetical protein AURDEDRAFT_112207 [Auricularia subglabra TFB-10046 SS5]|nr:hypothetical protein AURDEDRAFT_112207 [Auricularia subglabra TFB-10046 SS5]
MYIGIARLVSTSQRETQARKRIRTRNTTSGFSGVEDIVDSGFHVRRDDSSQSVDSSATPSAPSASTTELPFKRPKTESAAVYFQGPSTTNSTNRPALYGSIAGVVVVILLFVVYELYALRRKRQRAAADARRLDSEGVPFLAVQGNRDPNVEQDGKYSFTGIQPTTHMVSLPPPARLNANPGWSRLPSSQ